MRAVFQIAITILSMAISAHFAAAAWGWFVVPVFGVPALTPTQAYGVLCAVSAFLSPGLVSVVLALHPKLIDADKQFATWCRVAIPPFAYAVAWGISALYHSLFF